MTAPDVQQPRMHPFHVAIVAVGIPLLLLSGVALVLVKHGFDGELRAWLPLSEWIFGAALVGVPVITAAGSLLLARRAGRKSRPPLEAFDEATRAQLEHLRRNPPAPLTSNEREHLRTLDPETLTEEQRTRYLTADPEGLTWREKRKLLAVLTSGDDYRELGELLRQERMPSTAPDPRVVALRPLGFLVFALIVTALPLLLLFADVMIVLVVAGVVGTRGTPPEGWGILLIAPLLGWFVTLLAPAMLGMAITAWTCFVRSLLPRFRTSRIALIERRSITPIHRTRVTALAHFIEMTAWLPPLPLLGAAVLNGFALMALYTDWHLVAAALWAAGIPLAVLGVRTRWKRWKPTYDPPPTG
jgi:hypothetical protein